MIMQKKTKQNKYSYQKKACMLSHVQLFVMQWSLPGSSVLGILQTRIFEWIAIASPRKTFKPRDKTHLSCIDK